jgi:hypothetical protein
VRQGAVWASPFASAPYASTVSGSNGIAISTGPVGRATDRVDAPAAEPTRASVRALLRAAPPVGTTPDGRLVASPDPMGHVRRSSLLARLGSPVLLAAIEDVRSAEVEPVVGGATRATPVAPRAQAMADRDAVTSQARTMAAGSARRATASGRAALRAAEGRPAALRPAESVSPRVAQMRRATALLGASRSDVSFVDTADLDPVAEGAVRRVSRRLAGRTGGRRAPLSASPVATRRADLPVLSLALPQLAVASDPVAAVGTERAVGVERGGAERSAGPVAGAGSTRVAARAASSRPVSRAASRDVVRARVDESGRVSVAAGPRAYARDAGVEPSVSQVAPWRGAGRRSGAVAAAPSFILPALESEESVGTERVAARADVALPRAAAREGKADARIAASRLRVAPASAAALRASAPVEGSSFVVVPSVASGDGAVAGLGSRWRSVQAREASALFRAERGASRSPVARRGVSIDTVLIAGAAPAGAASDEVVVSRADAGREITAALRRLERARPAAAGVETTVLEPEASRAAGAVDRGDRGELAGGGVVATAVRRGEAQRAAGRRDVADRAGAPAAASVESGLEARASRRSSVRSRRTADALGVLLQPGTVRPVDAGDEPEGGNEVAATMRRRRPAARAQAMEEAASPASSRRTRPSRARRPAAGTLVEAGADLSGDAGVAEGRSGASRSRFVTPRNDDVAERSSLRAGSTIVNALARVESPEELVRIVRDSRLTPEQLRRELPGPAFKLVQRVEQMHTIAQQAKRTEDGDRSFARTRRGRSLPSDTPAVTLGETRFIPIAKPVSGELGSSASRVAQLANKLLNLIHLAEVDQRVQDARQQVRMSDSAPGEGAGSAGASSVTKSPNINALKSDVFDAVLRKLDELKSRSVEDPNGHAMWW